MWCCTCCSKNISLEGINLSSFVLSLRQRTVLLCTGDFSRASKCVRACVRKHNKKRANCKLPVYRTYDANLTIFFHSFFFFFSFSGSQAWLCSESLGSPLKQIAGFHHQSFWLSRSWAGPRVCMPNRFEVMLINGTAPEAALWEPTESEC